MEMMDLNLFPTDLGITQEVFKTGEMYYSEEPRSDTSYIRQIDNVTSIGLLFNLTIIRMDASNGEEKMGIIQVVNREPYLNKEQFVVG